MKTVKYNMYKMIYLYFLEIMPKNDEEVDRVRKWLNENDIGNKFEHSIQ